MRQGFKRVGADMQRTKAAIRNVDLDNKVQADTFSRALRAQRGRLSRSEYSIAASKVVDELRERLPDDIKKNEIVKTALPLAPLLFLKPHKRGRGFESVISDPRVWGPALAAGVALFSKTREQSPSEVVITPGTGLKIPKSAGSFQLNAVVRDRSGASISDRTIDWTSLDDSTASVVNGRLDLKKSGDVTIVATDRATGLSTAMTLTITE